jgi:hypothetical protein
VNEPDDLGCLAILVEAWVQDVDFRDSWWAHQDAGFLARLAYGW